MSDLEEIIVKNIGNLVEERGLSIRKTAQIVGVEYSLFFRYCKGKRCPNIDNLKKIADAFYKKIDWFLEVH